MNTLTYEPELGHITTFGGHPVCCAAAFANLNVIINEGLCDRASESGKLFKDALMGHPKIKEIRQIGLMLGIDLESSKIADKLVSDFIKNGLITDRFLFRPQSFRIAPPLIISKKEIEKSLELIEKSLEEL